MGDGEDTEKDGGREYQRKSATFFAGKISVLKKIDGKNSSQSGKFKKEKCVKCKYGFNP